ALEVDAGGEYPPAAGDHDGARGRHRLEASGQRLAELDAHGVGLAVSHAQDCDTVVIGRLDHVARSPPRMASVAAVRKVDGPIRSACTTAIVSTTIAVA